MSKNTMSCRRLAFAFGTRAANLSAIVAICVIAVACSGGGLPPVDPAATPSANLVLTAKGLRFQERGLVVPAGVSVNVRLDNEDKGINHNFALYTDKSAKTKIYGGELYSGPDIRDNTFTAPAAGTYFFRCDAHPDTMTGTLV